MASCIPYSLVSQCTAAPISIPCSVQATQSSPHVFARRTSDFVFFISLRDCTIIIRRWGLKNESYLAKT